MGGGSAPASAYCCTHLKPNPAHAGLKSKQVPQRQTFGHTRSDLADYIASPRIERRISWTLRWNLLWVICGNLTVGSYERSPGTVTPQLVTIQWGKEKKNNPSNICGSAGTHWCFVCPGLNIPWWDSRDREQQSRNMMDSHCYISSSMALKCVCLCLQQ